MARKKDSETLVEDPKTFTTTWNRGPDGSFFDLRKERCAMELAKGLNLMETAQVLELSVGCISSWAAHPEMRLRKRELRATPQVSQTFTVSIAMILAELHKNSTGARDNGDYKASTEALVHMYKIAKAEKSLLETFDAKVTEGSANVVAALQAHLSKVSKIAEAQPDDDV